MIDRAARRLPYRVVFTPLGASESRRRGVIVARDEESAHREARRVADAGGRAEVQHIGDDGLRRVVAVYPVDGGSNDAAWGG